MKKEILKELGDAGLLQTYEKHPIWKRAFELYWQQTGDTEAKMGCSTCYKKVLEWLRK